jgi:hypothetical protein
LPQELLLDWPWPLDLTQGFGNFQGTWLNEFARYLLHDFTLT